MGKIIGLLGHSGSGKRVVIYALVHPVTFVICYVGKTVISLHARLANHVYKARSGRSKGPLSEWLLSLLHQNLRPVAVELEWFPFSVRWQDRERLWIARLRDNGCPLLNIHPGGNGAHTRAKLSVKYAGLLGIISDARIAEQAGLCRETITYHRSCAGIGASCDRSRVVGWAEGHIPFNKQPISKKTERLFGVVSDYELAKRVGLTKSAVRNRRIKAGLPAYSGPKHMPCGEAHRSSKLTEEQVKIVRSSYVKYSRTNGCYALARRFNLHQTTIHAIVQNKTWKGVI